MNLNFNVFGGKSSGDDDNAKTNLLLEGTAAFQRINLLKGFDGVWISARRNNFYYILNKLVSMGIAFFFAFITLDFKGTTQKYYKQEMALPEEEQTQAAFHILTIYWFLFIYYSLAGMDEMIELFSVINELEKGALGLFFELNYLIGIFLTGYTCWFINKFEAPVSTSGDAKLELYFTHMYNWVFFQVCFLAFSLVMMVVVASMYKKINRQVAKMKPAHVGQSSSEAKYAINAEE